MGDPSDNHGVASLFIDDDTKDDRPFRLGRITRHSEKIMLVEEHAQKQLPDDGRWNPTTVGGVGLAHPPDWPPQPSQISNRHSGKGSVVFCDGHVEQVKPSFGNNPYNFDATL